MRQAIADLLSSKKFVTAIIGVAVVIGAKYGLALDPELLIAIASLFGILLHAQGHADHGKEGARIAADATSRSVDGKPRNGETGFVDHRMLAMMLVLSLVLPATFIVGSCVAVGKEARAVASSVVDCTAKQTAGAVRELRPLGDAMLVNALDNGKVDWSPVRDLAKSFVTDTARCVLADAVSRALHPPPADRNAPKLSPLEVDRDALRAGFRRLAGDLYGGRSFRTDAGDL